MKSEPTAAFLFPLPASPGVAGEKSAPAPEKKLKVGFYVDDGIDAVNKDLADTWKEQLMNFMCKGGKILVSGDEAVSFPSHRNLKVIPAGTSFVEEALARP